MGRQNSCPVPDDVYGVRMARGTVIRRRRRNIRWEDQVDELAVELAGPFRGGVSELLAKLVIAEGRRKVGVAHRTPCTLAQKGRILE